MSKNSNNSEEPTNQDGGDWGWEPLGSEDEEPENSRAIAPTSAKIESAEDVDVKALLPKTGSSGSSDKQLSTGARKSGSFGGSNKPIQGIVSSPSFLELEKAIGATLSLASNDSGELGENRTLSTSSSGTFPARLSSTNLTQQKVNQQRLRQQQHQQQQHNQRQSNQNQYSRSPHSSGYGYSFPPQMSYGHLMPPPMPMPMPALGPAPPARAELAPFINESESRAMVLFHSAHISAVDIRNACSRHGVLYYIRPEFHGRGVTLISYFDLRAATSAKACLADDLGPAADASAHYSVMLHAANGNSEEFRLVVRNLPAESCSEAEVQSIFARYGQLRSIQKTFEDELVTTPRSDASKTDSAGGAGEAAAGEGTSPGSSSGADAKTGVAGVAYTVEYYNIQDARLAASELSATSAQLWNADVTVKFAPLDDRKQQLCRQLLASLSRWRTEMAAAATYGVSLQQQQQHQHLQQQPQQPQQQQMRQFMNGGVGMLSSGSGMGPTPMPGMMMGVGVGGSAPHMMGVPSAYPGMGVQMVPNGYGGLVSAQSMGQMPYFDQQHQHQQQMGGYPGGGVVQYPESPGQVPMMVPAYQLSPMRSGLFPGGTLSNPNLFNFGLLAAQAEAQMQQQQQQQQAGTYVEDPARSTPAPSPAGGAFDYSATQSPQSQNGNGSRSGSGGNTPPHHNGAHSGGTQQFSSTHAGRPNAPLHHQHQQYAPQNQYQHQQPMQQYEGQGGDGSGGAGGYVGGGQQQARRGKPANGHHGGATAGATVGANGSGGGAGHHQIDADFALDLRRLGEDSETRTTIMVRNIPNKYNQQMLLDEVNVQHEGTYDFFYLPIDFKNRCNVGYCFINFLEPRFIAPFVRSFNGQRWKSFNSEKVCAVSFARIQGKQAMIGRFQNSSLLEKDDEYRPLLFHSSGPDRGKPEPFPAASNSGGGRNRGHSHATAPSREEGTRSRSASNSISPSPPLVAASPGLKQHQHHQHHQLHQQHGHLQEGGRGEEGPRHSNRSSPVEISN